MKTLILLLFVCSIFIKSYITQTVDYEFQDGEGWDQYPEEQDYLNEDDNSENPLSPIPIDIPDFTRPFVHRNTTKRTNNKTNNSKMKTINQKLPTTPVGNHSMNVTKNENKNNNHLYWLMVPISVLVFVTIILILANYKKYCKYNRITDRQRSSEIGIIGTTDIMIDSR